MKNRQSDEVTILLPYKRSNIGKIQLCFDFNRLFFCLNKCMMDSIGRKFDFLEASGGFYYAIIVYISPGVC